MGSFEPIINVLTVLTVLSVAAERATNLVKLRRHPEWKNDTDREREFRITWSNVLIGMGLAVLMKADLFDMLAHPDAPWSTLGWTQWNGSSWVRTASAAGPGSIAHALLGSAIAGMSLGFGSKFWHDVLGIVFEVRKLAQNHGSLATAEATNATGDDATKPGE